MKGLLVSLVVFIGYVLSTAIASHIIKPQRHSRLFFPAVALWTPLYFLLYAVTPADCYFLPISWQCPFTWLDVSYGFVVFLLNAHSYIDFFFGFNGGFSMSLMLEILRSGSKGRSSDELIGAYRRDDGVDTIYGWRLPRLAETGYLEIDPEKQTCRLTPKGRRIARFSWLLKRFLNLGAGG